MKPVHTEDCDVVYLGPNKEIGDLHVHRVRPHIIRATYEPNEEELEILKNGGRVRLFIMKEPIPPVKLEVVSEEDSHPVSEHPWKIDVERDDELNPEKDEEDEEDESVLDEVIEVRRSNGNG